MKHSNVKIHSILQLVWMKLNLAIALKCKVEVDVDGTGVDGQRSDLEKNREDALRMFDEVKKVFPNDPSSYLRQGQLLVASSVGKEKQEGKENLQQSVEICSKDKDFDSLKIDAMASYGSVAYENSELKQTSECFEHVLKNALFFATDEALCTMAQICIRRGKYTEAQAYYSVLGKKINQEEMKRITVAGSRGDSGTGFSSGSVPQKYLYERFQSEPLGTNLEWIESEAKKSA